VIEVTAVEPVRARRRLDSVTGFLRASRLNVIAVVIVGLIVLVAIFGTLVAPYPPNHIDLLQRLRPPSVHHLFGTDDYGRDLFSRVLAGAWISLYVATVILLTSVAILAVQETNTPKAQLANAYGIGWIPSIDVSHSAAIGPAGKRCLKDLGTLGMRKLEQLLDIGTTNWKRGCAGGAIRNSRSGAGAGSPAPLSRA